MANHPSRVTIRHVAQKAGVSNQTVSRVINNRPDVAPETRQRVQQIISQLGYQPSELARSLIQRRSYTLGVVTSGLKFIGPSRTLNGITNQAEQLGYELLLKELPRFDITDIQPILRSLLARHVDGLLWAVPEIGDNRTWVEAGLPALPIPIVFITQQLRSGLSVVSVDNHLGGVLATQHLIDQGRKHIGHLSGPLDWWEARQRKQGWEDALKSSGRPVVEHSWVEGNWSSASAEAAFQRLLQSYPEMDAVFVANDQMALSVLKVAGGHALRIPQDLAVVGFDNLAESAYYQPALSTVNQNLHELGCQAVQMLTQLIESFQKGEESPEPHSTLLPPELIVRESSILPS